MLSPVEAPISIIRVCGHRETETVRYRGRTQRMNREAEARKCFCKACRDMVAGWMAGNEAAPYPLELPQLIGSAGQISWACDLRAKVARKMLPVMTMAANHGGKTGAAVWQALYALLSQRQSRFWIDGRELGYSQHFVLSEASYFAMGLTYGVIFSERSIFGRWKKQSPYLIDEVKKRCPVSQVSASA